jgi:hypothetical protein
MDESAVAGSPMDESAVAGHSSHSLDPLAATVDVTPVTPKEKAILDERRQDFRRNPHSGASAEQLRGGVLQRLKPQ